MTAAVAAPPPAPTEALVVMAPGADATVLGSSARRLMAGSRIYRVGMPADGLASLRRLPGVTGAEANRIRRVSGTVDPLRIQQPFLTQVGWTPQAESRRPIVAVLDTGVDARHPDLRGAVMTRRARSFTDASALADRSGHGTHVAGLIAAMTDNGVGGSGLSRALILPVRITDAAGDADTASLVRGIRYAVAQRAQVLNISIGGQGFSAFERDAINDAVRRGVVVVAASGNGGRAGNAVEYPAAYPHVLAVAAVNDRDSPLRASTSGPQVTLAGPGRSILSTAPGGEYRTRSGTSMAAAITSGVVARLLVERPGLSPSQVEEVLTAGARDVATPGRDDLTGYGVVSLTGARAVPTPPADVAEPNDDPAQVRGPAFLQTGVPSAVADGTLAGWFDPADGVRVQLTAGERVVIDVAGQPGLDPDLAVWRPGAPARTPGADYVRRWLAASSLRPGATERLEFTATTTGIHTVEVRGGSGRGTYHLTIARDPAAVPAPPPA